MTEFIVVVFIAIIVFTLTFCTLHFSKYKKDGNSGCCGQCTTTTCEKGHHTPSKG